MRACVRVCVHAQMQSELMINDQTNNENETKTDINLLSFLSNCSGCEVNVLPVWRLHPAGGAADVEHHGGVRLAHLLHCHIKVPGIPGVYQYFENDSGQQVGMPFSYIFFPVIMTSAVLCVPSLLLKSQ